MGSQSAAGGLMARQALQAGEEWGIYRARRGLFNVPGVDGGVATPHSIVHKVSESSSFTMIRLPETTGWA
jgi:hypothetical protein